MHITVNGEPVELPQGATILEYLEKRGYTPAAVVVERNRDIVPAAHFGATILKEGDVLEVLHFVGGG